MSNKFLYLYNGTYYFDICSILEAIKNDEAKKPYYTYVTADVNEECLIFSTREVPIYENR